MRDDYIIGDALTHLWRVPGESVQTCITKPPVWRGPVNPLDDEIGTEPTADLYVKRLIEVFREVKRALKPNGTLWLHMEDVRAQGLPWLVAFALREDGWSIQGENVWSRPTGGHETVFLLSRGLAYHCDAEALQSPLRPDSTVWELESEGAVIHRCVAAGSREGDLVLDPFAGTGTTLGVAAGLQRHFLGIELDPINEPAIRECIRPAVEYRSQRAGFEAAMELE